jgi:hypothetical protein
MNSFDIAQALDIAFWAVMIALNIMLVGQIVWITASKITKWRINNIDREFRAKHRASLVPEKGLTGVVKRIILEVEVSVMAHRLAKRLTK